MSVPKLRFPGFEGEWEKRKLGDVATFAKGKGISKADISDVGTTPCIRYGELYTHYGTGIDKVLSATNVPVAKLKLSQGGEVIVPASGEDAEDIATAAVVLCRGVALGGDLNVIRCACDGFFLASYIAGKKRLALAAMAQGNSVVHLYPAQLRSLALAFPSLPEQQKIATFLGAVDAKLAALAAKQAALVRYKAGLVQKLFSQQLRFARDDGKAFPEWDVRDLGGIASRSAKKNKNLSYMRVLTNSAVHGVIDQRDFFDKDIANSENLGGYYVVKKGDFVYNPRISVSAPVGPIKRNNLGDGVMSPLYTVFRFHDENTDFFAHYFQTSLWHDYMKSVANYGARHDRMAITIGDLMLLPLPFPHPDEQQKIADALSAFDTKIQAVADQAAKLKTFKKGLLQQMFV